MIHDRDGSTADRTARSAPAAATSKWRLIKNVLTGVIGVQSDTVHEQDMPPGSLETFLMKVAIGGVLFVLAVLIIL